MFKFNAKIKVVPTIGIVALPVMLMSLVYAAAIFPPNSNPVVIGYVAQPALSNFNLLGGTEKIYRGEYEKGGWSGNLSCYPVSNAGVVSLATPCWSAGSAVGAASVVDKQGFASGSRNIATRGATGGAAFALAVNPTVLLDAAHVNFIRGDRSQEAPAAAGLRTRLSVLGDSIHSRPYYHADPTSPTVFYGANDGMMHAVDAITGSERWAYIPSMLIPKLPKLWASPYVHENFVDGNVNVTNAGTAALPQNILVGVLGSGGKGIYALDVTNLTAASDAGVAAKSLWEITPTTAGFANLGDTYSNPTLYPVETGASAVMVGNGYNNTGSGVASLFVIDTKTGALIKEISTGIGTLASPNGLSTPVAIDANNNGRADFVYAGDIDGNMWKFDLSNASPANWSVSLLYSTKSNAATPAGQAITMKPDLARSPLGGYMVTFATGRILTAADQADTAVHYAYGIWDGAPASNTTLAAQTITVRPYSANVNVRVVGAAPGSNVVPNYALGGDKGWKIALPAGERGVGDSAFIQFGRFFFNAANPTQKFTPAGGVTNSGSGENALMALDYLMGSPASPFFDMNGDGLLNAGDRVKYIAGDTIPTPSVVGDPIASNFGVPVGFVTTNGVQSHPVFGNVGGATAIFYNQNFDLTLTPATTPTPPGAVGIGGGHFDAESFYHVTNNSAATSTRSSTVGVAVNYAHQLHDHEYDKKWNVNGLNLLNPSGRLPVTTAKKHWMGESVNSTTPYKVLVFNQAWNRSVEVKIGPGEWVSTKDYQTQARATVLAGLQTYTGNTETIVTTTPPALPVTTTGTGTIKSLQLRMPYNAFAINDWWGDGVKINGLIPLDSSCVKGSGVPAGNGYSLLNPVAVTTGLGTDNEMNPYIGPNGERHDGALTIQIIRADTPDASIVLNVAADVTMPDGKVVPKEQFGYRVRNTDINKYVMHEESVFWHHDVAPCMSGVSPGKATTTAKNTIPARGVLAEKAGTPASCTGGGAVIPEDPLTCKLVAAKLVYTPASCTTGTYTRPKPAYPAYPATAAITGWTPAMPLDRSDSEGNVWPNPTARPCGTDDPHNASFVPAVNGVGGGTGTTTPPPVVTIPTNLMGGAALGAIRPPTLCTPGTPGCTCVGSVCTNTNGGATTTGCVKGTAGCTCVPNPTGGETCSKDCVPNPVTGETCGAQGSQERTGRLSWRELIN